MSHVNPALNTAGKNASGSRGTKTQTYTTNIKTLIIAATIALATLAAPSAQAGYCPPVYKTSTCVVDKCSYKKWTTDYCGKRYSYTVTVVTYRDTYSNGTSKTYKQSFRS